MLKSLKARIVGRVQGVFFRDFIKKNALKLGLKGWVRNADSDVEFFAEGSEEALKRLLQLCRLGPAGATVKKINFEWREFKGDYKSFEIIY